MRFVRILAVTSLAVFFILLGTSSLMAQFSSGLGGTVFDPTGAIVPNAVVNLHEVSTGIEHSTTTSSVGIYQFTALPPSTFILTVKAAGFETVTINEITLQVAENRVLNVNLKVGAATSTVNVTAEVTPVNLASGAVSGQINETKVHELPLVGRNMFSLVILTPGVTGLPSGGGQAYAQATADIFNAELGVNLNANGQRSESNSFSVDGATTNGNPRGGVTNLTPNADSIQEVQIQTNNFSAQYGRNAAVIVNVESKAGTNDFHGTLSWFHTDTHLNSRTIFQNSGGLNNQGAPLFLRNEFAGSLGGPIRKDKDFAFASIDMLRSGVGTAFPAQIPTPQFVSFLKATVPNNTSTGVLSSFPLSFTPTSGFQTAGAEVGSTCTGSNPIGPTGSITAANPLAATPCNLPVSGVGDFSTTVFRNGVQWSTRIDHNWNNFKDRLYGSFYRTTRQTVEFASPSVYFPNFSPAEPEYTHLLNLNWTHSTGGNFVNQMTASYTRTFGDAPCDNCQVPAEGVDTGSNLPGNGFLGVFKQNNYEWKDVASLVKGRQNFKFGANFARHHDDELFTDTTRRPTFQFANLLQFANDTPYNESNIQFDPRTGQVGAVNVDFAYRSSEMGAFIQDDFKMKPNFTVNMGLRWETFTGPTERFDRLNNGVFSNTGTWQEKIASMKMAGVPQLWHTPVGNLAPRLGFAWDPTKKGKMSVRGGAGLFYDRPENQLYTGDRNNLPLVANASCSLLSAPACTPVYGLGATGKSPYNFPAVPGIATTGLNAQNGLIGVRTYQVVTDEHLHIQYGENWSLGVQREVFSNWLVEGDYLGSVGHHLYSAYDVNRFSGDIIQNGGVTGYNSSFGGIQYGQSNYNSAYNGGTLSIHNRGFQRGINFQAAYTFGKVTDQAATFGVEPVDPLNLGLERGLADFDISRRLSFSTLWQIPRFGGNSTFANVLLHGWQLSNITILQKGSPFTVFCGASYPTCDYNADGMNNDRPDVVGGVPTSGFSKNQFLNTGIFNCTAAMCGNLFPAPGPGLDGSLGRNTFIGPGYINTDFSAAKKTRIPWFVGKEGAQMEFRAEFFNVFNNVNLTGVSSDLAGGNFGKASGVFPARDIQFGLRIEF
ncbi:MAG TPA: carboxypeptidase regulatory-like domain-containing protein [Terriglobia bacterium]|nr:carboxypeptidase regulatory-like domain-containing protein [Terriglobia bacterium]